MLLLSNGFDGLAALPVIPNESIDPIRFLRALSAMVPPLSAAEVPISPSELRLFIVNADFAAAGAGG